MGTQWTLKTQGDPLRTIRRFLYALWQHDGLDGLILPIYQNGGSDLKPYLLEDPKQLVVSDPLIPFVAENSAKLVAQFALERSDARLGTVLRSCEARALAEKVRQGSQIPDNWLLIGIDCLCSFPMEDLAWRIQKVGSLENLTREALRFARQGSIAPYRFRQACQMCVAPSCEDVDVNIELIGLPVKECILISTRNEAISSRLGLSHITDGPAPRSIRAQHQRMVDLIIERRTRCRDRKIVILEGELPSQASELLALLVNCAPCQKCLDACPIYAHELAAKGNGNGTAAMKGVNYWLAACVACGMCEQACPRHLPLTVIHCRISQKLKQAHLPIGA
jgi:formate dehydrogenase subunit beta